MIRVGVLGESNCGFGYLAETKFSLPLTLNFSWYMVYGSSMLEKLIWCSVANPISLGSFEFLSHEIS